MNEQEAKDRCAQLAAEHPDREHNQWIPVKGKDDTWTVARIALPPPLDPTGTEIRKQAEPTADDPRNETPWLDPSRSGWFGIGS